MILRFPTQTIRLAYCLIGCAVFSGYALDTRIREAAYLFEIEGKTEEAKNLLIQVLALPASEDYQDALLSLAKIYDWTGQADSALRLYRHYLQSNPEDAEITVWVSNRISALDSSPPPLVLSFTTLGADPLITAQAPNRAYLMLSNGIWYVSDEQHLKRLNTKLNPGQIIAAATAKSAWIYQPEQLILSEHDTRGVLTNRKITLDAPLQHAYPLSNQRLLVITAKSVRLYRSTREIWMRKNTLKGCKPVAESASALHIYLNCPDNALHILQMSDGAEIDPIGMLEPIDTVLATSQGLFVANTNGQLWHFKPQRHRTSFWQLQFSGEISLAASEDRLAVLETDGTLSILRQGNGELLTRVRAEPGYLFTMDGNLGILSWEGNLHWLNARGQRYWVYQSGSTPAMPPLTANGAVHLLLQNRSLITLNGRYFGSPPALIDQQEALLLNLSANHKHNEAFKISDSLLKLEPGNSNAWVAKALYYASKANDSALLCWSRAARFSNAQSGGYSQRFILNGLAKAARARWVQTLPPAARSYPYIIGDARNLYALDPDNKNIAAIDPQSGQFRWRAPIHNTEKNLILAHDDRLLALACGYSVFLYDLRQQGRLIASLDLPGKTFQMLMSPRALFVSTWNGFIVRLNRSPTQPVWSKKLFNEAAHLALDEGLLYAMSLDGTLAVITSESGTLHNRRETQRATVSHLLITDSFLIAAAADGSLLMLDKQLEKSWNYSLDQQIFSMQNIILPENRNLVLIGLANQSLVLFDPERLKPLWSFPGENSVLIRPSISGSTALIDQGNRVIQIALEDGRVIRQWDFPEGSGPVWSNPSSLLVSTRQGFLFYFTLE